MPSKIYSCSLSGIEAYGVEIEVDILRGLSRFTVVGLGDTAVQESKERVRSAIVNSGGEFPRQRKVVNLAPAHTRKVGAAFDLPIAIGLLVDSNQIPKDAVGESLFLGELALDGGLRHTKGVLACALFAKENGFKKLYVPTINSPEATLVSGLEIFPVGNLETLISHLKGEAEILPLAINRQHKSAIQKPKHSLNLEAIRGVGTAIRALAIAAAGGHHLLMTGPPGSGKTLLAQHLPSLLPKLSRAECIELTKLYSVAGLLPPEKPMITRRPFRSIHHTSSMVSLVGGGSIIRPGEISLAHRGVLFLDEIAEFQRSVLDTLRQPLEEKLVTIARASGRVTFPASFTLIGAMNPCPCGYFGDNKRECICTSSDRRRYRQKLSGPLMDRIDLFIKMRRLSFDDIHSEETVDVKKLHHQIQQARCRQIKRLRSPTRLNSDMSSEETRTICVLDSKSYSLLKKSINQQMLSTRGYFRVLKLARTLADMEDSDTISQGNLLEALNYRQSTQIA